MKSFEQWYNNINEDLASEPVAEPTIATEVEVETPRDAMMHDVDSIMTSLETLAAELKESLEAEVTQLNEADDDKPSLVMQWVWHAPRMAKKQAKINNMKLKESDMEIAAAKLQGSEDSDKKKYLVDKGRQLSQNIKEIQAQVNDMAASKGSYVEKVVKRKRLEGDLAVVKAQIGNIGDSKEMKARMQDITNKMKEEDAAIQDLTARAEDEAQDLKGDDKIQMLKKQKEGLKEVKSEVDAMKDGPEKEIAQAKLAVKLAQIDLDIAIEDPNQSKSIDGAKEKLKKAEGKLKKVETEGAQGSGNTPPPPPPPPPGKTGKNTGSQGAQGSGNTPPPPPPPPPGKTGKNTEDPKVKAIKDKIAEYERAIKDLSAKKDKASKDKIAMIQQAIAKEKKDLEKLTPKESLIVRALDASLNELSEEIVAKLEWQLTEGSALYIKYDTIIRKAEFDNQLNEALYTSVKDRFRNLL